MTYRYHNASTDRTTFVLSQDGTRRTPADDGFVILPRHRDDRTGNIHWRLIWRDFAHFLGVSDDDILDHDPLWLRDRLSATAEARGYDGCCVGALCWTLVLDRQDALTYAAALGFDPIHLWPGRCGRWPRELQYLPVPSSAAPSPARPSLHARLRAGLLAARAAFLAEVRGDA